MNKLDKKLGIIKTNSVNEIMTTKKIWSIKARKYSIISYIIYKRG